LACISLTIKADSKFPRITLRQVSENFHKGNSGCFEISRIRAGRSHESRKRWLELGTLLIDEGFGSLSEETLSEVIDVLIELRFVERLIQIISRVEGMKTQILLRIEVRTSVEGPSTIRFATTEMQSR
jgi:hypothetical protein